jgi:hypothetical protein
MPWKKTGHPGADQLDPGPEDGSGFPAPSSAKGDVPFLGFCLKKARITPAKAAGNIVSRRMF